VPTSVDGLLRGLATRPVAEWVGRWEQSVAKSIWVDGRATTRADRHREVALDLLARGSAYRDYMSPDELTEERERARAEGRAEDR
jgi:glutamyl/glutaminyl-tRNA synthetase